jgi:hypothetical protein
VGRVRRAVGIDWGRFAVAVLAERGTSHVAVTEARIFDGSSLNCVGEIRRADSAIPLSPTFC